ncbi:MAG: sulfatase [Pirellulaceae bacterium]
MFQLFLRRWFSVFVVLGCWFAWCQNLPGQTPNVIVIYADDLGYSDIGPFAKTAYPTPELDRMAREGRRFTDFLVSSAVCSASRAALMTGCYHMRINISGALAPNSKKGIAAGETTLAELCKSRGYATGCIGKWHLGHQQKFLPLQHGFDSYFGLPYSNDMWPFHPSLAKFPPEAAERKKSYPDLPLLRDNEVINPVVRAEDQAQLTTQYTEQAVEFIRDHQDRPFFLYVAHSMVHVPLFVSKKFEGKSGVGLYGDVMMELDWSTGQILQTLRDLKLDRKTLVIFTSDNGPWLPYGNHAGSALPLREGKGTSFEGGVRVPMIAWWPDKIAPGSTCDELASTIDVFPTVAKLINAELPSHKIDGQDMGSLLFAKPGDDSIRSPHEFFYCYYGGDQLQAIRDRQFKLVFPHTYPSLNGKPGGKDGSPAGTTQLKAESALYDLKLDPSESKDVAADFPEVIARLNVAAEKAREELGDGLTKRKGNSIRPADTSEE